MIARPHQDLKLRLVLILSSIGLNQGTLDSTNQGNLQSPEHYCPSDSKNPHMQVVTNLYLASCVYRGTLVQPVAHFL